MISSTVLSLYLCLVYLFFYTNLLNLNVTLLFLAALLSLHVAYIVWNRAFINKAVVFSNTHTKLDIDEYPYPGRVILIVQISTVAALLLAGVSGYCLLLGVSLPVSPGDVVILTASINISWLVGHLAVFSPRGLGVREGAMLLLLNKIVPVETALLFPILFRVLISVVDLFFIVFALVTGARRRVYADLSADGG